MNIPKVSIIIPVYNTERFFEKCLRSLFEQTLDNIEYIFINDCTPDNSMMILNNILEEYPNRKSQVRIINHEKNKGSGVTKKEGMMIATGEYVIHCDSDDWVDVDFYEKMYNNATEENADIVCCCIYYEYIKKRVKSTYLYAEINDDVKKFNFRESVLTFSLCNKLVRRNLYVDYNVYPYEGVNKWEDVSVSARLLYFSNKTIVDFNTFYHYNKQNDSSIVTVPSISKVKEQILCAQYIEDFFQKQKDYHKFHIFINNLKFVSKGDLLLTKSIRDIKKWSEIYLETHKYIWKYTDYSLKMRILLYVAIKGHPYLFCRIMDSIEKLKKIII